MSFPDSGTPKYSKTFFLETSAREEATALFILLLRREVEVPEQIVEEVVEVPSAKSESLNTKTSQNYCNFLYFG